MPQGEVGTIEFRWDPSSLEIKTRSVEQTLEPLVTQVMDTNAALADTLTFLTMADFSA